MSTEPRRLLDDPGADPKLREALRGFAEEDVPFDVTRGLDRLRAARPTPPTAGVPRARPWWVKGIVGASALGVAGFLLLRPEAPTPSGTVAPPPVETPPRVNPPPPPSEALAPEPGDESHGQATPPDEVAPSAQVVSPKRPPKRAPLSPETLAAEVRNLAELRRLVASDPAAAVGFADEGHRRFAEGALYQEREAVAISALARAGRQAEAHRRGARFLARFPRSPFADQVRADARIAD